MYSSSWPEIHELTNSSARGETLGLERLASGQCTRTGETTGRSLERDNDDCDEYSEFRMSEAGGSSGSGWRLGLGCSGDGTGSRFGTCDISEYSSTRSSNQECESEIGDSGRSRSGTPACGSKICEASDSGNDEGSSSDSDDDDSRSSNSDDATEGSGQRVKPGETSFRDINSMNLLMYASTGSSSVGMSQMGSTELSRGTAAGAVARSERLFR